MAREQLGYKSDDGCVAPGLGVEVTASGGATKTLTMKDCGRVHLFDAATGVAYTLPPITSATVGAEFEFLVSVDVTSNAHSVTTDAATTFIGGAVQQIIDASATTRGDVADEAADTSISMNGTTTGGLTGTRFKMTAISTTVWSISGTNVGSGVLATAFA